MLHLDKADRVNFNNLFAAFVFRHVDEGAGFNTGCARQRQGQCTGPESRLYDGGTAIKRNWRRRAHAQNQAGGRQRLLVIHDGSECKDYQHQWQRNLGPVKTEAEKNAIANKAETIAGAGKVNNQIEVKNQ